MPRNRLTLAVAVLVIVVLLLQLVAFRVRETERVVVKRLGEATRAVKEPGLYWKWPWPIEEVVRQDARLRCLEGPLEETVTKDRKKRLISRFVTCARATRSASSSATRAPRRPSARSSGS